MRRAMIVILAAAAVCTWTPALLAQQKKTPPSQPSNSPTAKAPARAAPAASSRQGEEAAVRAVAEAFVKAYNARDAKAIAALFTPEAEIVNEEGEATQGRAEIEQIFADIFDERGETRMSVAIKSIRFLSPSLAVEDGSTTVVDEIGGEERNRYNVIHVKQDGKWLMASARDLADEPSGEELEQLAWMVGEWVDESPDALVATSTQWTDNKRFLLSEFTMQVAGKPVMNGSQRIGWDPLAKCIRSWVFDSEGGFAEGVYSRDGERWIIKLTGVTRDGKPASATNTITHISKDLMSWQSRDRTVGGEPQPDIDPVLVTRKPPQPM